MKLIRQIVSETRRLVRYRLFGNNHSLGVNLRYAAYSRTSRAKWEPTQRATESEQSLADSFRRTGYEVLPPPDNQTNDDLVSLKGKVDRSFEEPAGKIEIDVGLFRLIDGLEKVPEIAEFIDPSLERVIEAYYGSHFKIYGVYFYHTVPCLAKPQSSFLWHFDNCPAQEIKLMIYLDAVTADTGAIRLKTKSASNDLKRRGFTHRRYYERVRNELDHPKTTFAVEGPIGTRILFQNNGVIHKAVLPEREHRDVVTFVIVPSEIGWRAHFARSRHLLSTNSGICLNPATDKPQSMGYRE